MKEVKDDKGENALEKHTAWLKLLPSLPFNMNDEKVAGFGRGAGDLNENAYLQRTFFFI